LVKPALPVSTNSDSAAPSSRSAAVVVRDCNDTMLVAPVAPSSRIWMVEPTPEKESPVIRDASWLAIPDAPPAYSSPMTRAPLAST
jgi:hypothetical protein